MLRQHADSNNSQASIFIHLGGLLWQQRDRLGFHYVLSHTLNMRRSRNKTEIPAVI